MQSLIAAMTQDHIHQTIHRFNTRVAAGAFAGQPMSTIRVMGVSGDRLIHVPQIESLDTLDALDQDARVMIELAEQIVREAAARGRTIVAQAPGGALTPTRVRVFEPTVVQSLVILGALAGG
jgi:hypothetical protein